LREPQQGDFKARLASFTRWFPGNKSVKMSAMLLNLLKQPLLHFLIAGGAIFAFNALTTPPSDPAAALNDHQILVDHTTLLDFMQYRAKAFEPAYFETQLAALSDDELNTLIGDYVREEALYREALAMGMNEGDYIIRQRLVQKVEFLLENLVAQLPDPDAETLAAFYQERLADYHVDAVYTFTHIFFDAQQGGMETAHRRAERQLLESTNITFEDASQYGDRYPFLQNYVERTRDFVANNFSTGFVEALDLLPAETPVWQGPIESRYGVHLVMLRERADPFTPALEQIRDRVLDDYRYETLVRRRQEAEAGVVAGYEVIRALEEDSP